MYKAGGAPLKKYISYSAINFGFSTLGMAAATLLMYYYTDVLALPTLAVSFILFTVRMFDGLVDPFLGHYMDKRSTRFGKYRGYVIYWAFPACIAFTMMFSPSPFTGTGKIIWCMSIYLAFTLAFSFVEIASLPMLASFDTRESRSAGNTLKITGCIIATLGVTMFSVKLVHVLGDGSEHLGYSRMAMLLAGLALATLLAGGLNFNEGRYSADDSTEAREKYTVLQSIRVVLNEKSIALLLCMHLCLDAASMFKMQAGIYYLKYNIGRQDLTSLFLTSSIVVSLMTQPLVFYCSRKFGVRTLMTNGCIVSAVAMLTIGLSGTSAPLLIAGNCLYGAASAFPANLVFSYIVDLFEQLERKHGKPFGGVANAFIGLTSRVGGSLASGILSFILFAASYTPNEAQSIQTLMGISIGFIILPTVTLLLGGACASASFNAFESERALQHSGGLVSSEAEI